MPLGKLHFREPYIDYTDVARPLNVDEIYDDITQLHIQFVEPSVLKMWEHQWDYILKTSGIDRRVTPPSEETPEQKALRVHPNTLWGIPVEVKS